MIVDAAWQGGSASVSSKRIFTARSSPSAVDHASWTIMR